MKPKRTALYARVSTGEQTVENQLRELEEAGERLGWEIVGTFTDEALSGATGRAKRPALDRLLKGVTRKEFDIVATWSVDRIGRSLPDLLSFLTELHERDIDLYLHQQGLDTSTSSGRAMFQMLGVFAEFERAMIVERTKSGMERARVSGKRIGRPSLTDAIRLRIVSMLKDGVSKRKIAQETGVSRATVLNVDRARVA